MYFSCGCTTCRCQKQQNAVQLETDSSSQNESPHEEELELLRVGNELRLEGSSMRQVFSAGKSGRLGGIVEKNDRLNAWACAKLRDCYSEVEQEDEDRKSAAKLILQQGTDFSRLIVVPVEGQGGVTLSYVCPHCHRYAHEDCIWWVP